MITPDELRSYTENMSKLNEFIQKYAREDEDNYTKHFMFFPKETKDFSEDFSATFRGDAAFLVHCLKRMADEKSAKDKVGGYIEKVENKIKRIQEHACKAGDEIYKLCEAVRGQLDKFKAEVTPSQPAL